MLIFNDFHQVMDDRWETDITEFGAINITGFRLVDDSRPFVRHFLYNWRNLNVKEYPGAGEYISVSNKYGLLAQLMGFVSHLCYSITNFYPCMHFSKILVILE